MRKCTSRCVKRLKRGQVTLSSVGKAATKRLRGEEAEERRREAPEPRLWHSCCRLVCGCGRPPPCGGDPAPRAPLPVWPGEETWTARSSALLGAPAADNVTSLRGFLHLSVQL
ncbi:hypothetical protein GDO81_018640 [Engystomops pustulosus]|uniref:Uncharacterized protein n=1 Tax=Engystomops pustulosus TaxID=76066 RepID=A0AAV6ZR53_ENGPU|nr:hypothetical protein GDO81_018640 [Engystomops pustulosus]